MKKKLLLSVIFIICNTQAISISFITKCIAEDTECIKKSAQAAIPIFAAGIPEYKMQPLDPLHISHIKGNSPSLNYRGTNITVTGMRDCIVEEVTRGAVTLKINMTFTCDKILIKSLYEVHGRILIVPFEGDGDMRVVLRKLWIYVDSDLVEKIDKQGRKHWQIKNYTYKYDLKGMSDVKLTNLFKGNELLGRAARQLIKTSSNEVILEVSPPMVKEIIERITKSINQFYHAIPLDDLALD